MKTPGACMELLFFVAKHLKVHLQRWVNTDFPWQKNRQGVKARCVKPGSPLSSVKSSNCWRARVQPCALRHSHTEQLISKWVRNCLAHQLSGWHLGTFGKRTQGLSGGQSWFQDKKPTHACRNRTTSLLRGRAGAFLLPKPEFAGPKRQSRVAIPSEHDTDVLGRTVYLSGARQELSVSEVRVKPPSPCTVKTKHLMLWLSRSRRKEKEGGRCPSPLHPAAGSIARGPGVWGHQKLQSHLQPARGRNPGEPLRERDHFETGTEETTLI